MYTVEFQAEIKNGKIEIPEKYLDELSSDVVVILRSKSEQKNPSFLQHLIDHPIEIENFHPFTREEIYERRD